MLYHITKKDVQKAVQVLGKSFLDDPLFSYILPDRPYREKKIEYLFSFLINIGMLNGEVVAPSNNLEGVSIWINSSAPGPSVIKILWNCLIPLFLKIDPRSALRFIKIGMHKKRKRKDIIKESYYLLDVIGIDPEFQNLGYARGMIEPKLKEYDNQANPCYLETSNKENIPFYEKFDFHLCYEYQFKSIKVFGLRRESRLNNVIN